MASLYTTVALPTRSDSTNYFRAGVDAGVNFLPRDKPKTERLLQTRVGHIEVVFENFRIFNPAHVERPRESELGVHAENATIGDLAFRQLQNRAVDRPVRSVGFALFRPHLRVPQVWVQDLHRQPSRYRIIQNADVFPIECLLDGH